MSTSQHDPKTLQTNLDESRKRVDTDFFDLSLRELVRMVEDGELQARPEYQRQFRWPEVTQCELIESLLVGLPIPAVFVATNDNASWDLVDGLQRVSTIVHFMGSESARKKLGLDSYLRLSGLTQLSDFNGIAFDDLPGPMRFLLEKRYLRVQVLNDQSDFEVRFELFRRLNSGAIALSNQEVRTVLYRSPFNSLIEELAKQPTFTSLVKLQKNQLHDGTASELVLKFFAYLNQRSEFDGAVTIFLNRYMESRVNDVELRKDYELFSLVVERLGDVTDGPIKTKRVGWTPLNQFEAIMTAAGELIREEPGVTFKPQEGWLDDETLVAHSTKGTNTKNALNGRIDRAKELLLGGEVRNSK